MATGAPVVISIKASFTVWMALKASFINIRAKIMNWTSDAPIDSIEIVRSIKAA